MAAKTEQILLGTAITPAPRRDPTKLIREILSLHTYSKGRIILGVGLGISEEFRSLGHEPNIKIRAEMLDEQLQIITSALKGEKVTFKGKYFKLKNASFLPSSSPSVTIPIWFGATWPNKTPFHRAAVYGDGIIPLKACFKESLTPTEIKEIVNFTNEFSSEGKKLDIAVVGPEPDENEEIYKKVLRSYEDAGMTWFLQIIGDFMGDYDEIVQIVKNGPPKW